MPNLPFIARAFSYASSRWSMLWLTIVSVTVAVSVHVAEFFGVSGWLSRTDYFTWPAVKQQRRMRDRPPRMPVANASHAWVMRHQQLAAA